MCRRCFFIKEWYLITPNTRPNITGGFENDAFLDYKVDAFAESLNTDIAKSVTLYNYDLTKSLNIKCIIQGNSADTQLKSIERIGLFEKDTVKAGMYIFYENRYWLIIGYPSYNGIYEKAVMQLCQYNLRWQNSKGDIIERWISASSASKYDSGESGNSTIMLTSDNLTLLLPNDDESLNLDGKRVFIDKKDVNPTKVYKITRTDSVLYDFGENHGGILAFIADKTELNLECDRPDMKLCDYFDISTVNPEQKPNETDVLRAKINGSANLKIGKERTYTAKILDEKGNILEWNDNFSWKIICDFEIDIKSENNTLSLFIDDDQYIDDSFLLQVINNNTVIGELSITIVDIF